jgi:hypothetical protein
MCRLRARLPVPGLLGLELADLKVGPYTLMGFVLGFWCFYGTGGLNAGGAACEREQGYVAGALDGYAQPALMARADAGHAARENFATLLDELREDVGAFVVDEVHLLDTEFADLLLAEILAFAAARAPWPSAGTARATFTTTATAATGAAFATATAASAHGTSLRAWGSASASPWVSASTGASGWISAFARMRRDGAVRLLLFLCHNCLPFRLLRYRFRVLRNDVA